MRLDIYVARHCQNGAEALGIAQQAKQISGLEVRVVHVDEATEPIPEQVVAVPTYLLDGRVVSRGNPERGAFLALLEQQRERGGP